MSEDMVEEVLVEDLSVVNEQRSVLPATPRVKVRIAKANTQANKDGDIKSLKLELRIVDGILNADGIAQYVNKPLFTGIMDLVYWGDLSVKGRSEKNWWKSKQYLIEFKKFCLAVGVDLKDIKVNEDFLVALVDREVQVDIQHEEESIVDSSTGERMKTGTFKERLRNWRKAE